MTQLNAKPLIRETTNERVHFRLIVMPCCKHQFCWINPRWPNYCPECGVFIYPRVRRAAIAEDAEAMLRLRL